VFAAIESRSQPFGTIRPTVASTARFVKPSLLASRRDNGATQRESLFCAAATFAAIVIVVLPCAESSAAPVRTQLEPVVRGLREPVYVTAPRSEPRRLYVVEQRGLVRVVAGGRLLPRPFLDVRRLVLHKELAGLLSLAFAPDYRRSRRLYVDYVGRDRDVHVVEYRAGGGRALPSTARELLHVVIPSKSLDNHYGGQLAFGPDGFLYVGIGDGTAKAAAQDPESLLGKLVRIDPRRDPVQPEIVAYGLRNPWRFSFDRATGDLSVGDVGADTWEEVDYLPRGTRWPVDFGWPAYGGRARLDEPAPAAPGKLVFPALVYRHARNGCSAVVGGYVYRGRGLASLRGRYVYGDFCAGKVWSVRMRGGRARGRRLEATLGSLISSFGEDAAGELYVCAYGARTSSLFRLGAGS
jgi:glucose/arabinose dehydrogenase